MDIKYIGMDVHKETISIAVMKGDGKLVMESIIETKASTILQFIQGVRGDLHVTFEEGTWAGWLYDLLKPHVTELIVCDPRKNALMKEGNKSDKVDARKLADLLRGSRPRRGGRGRPPDSRRDGGATADNSNSADLLLCCPLYHERKWKVLA